MNITKWAVRTVIAVVWLLTAADLVPVTSALIDGEVWLTNQVADPLLFAFASGMLLAMLLTPTLWTDSVRAIGRAGALLTKFLTVRFARDEDAPQSQETEHFTPKLVVSKTKHTSAPKPTAFPPAIEEPVEAHLPELELEPTPSAFAALPAEEKPEPKPTSAIPPQPSALDLIMPNQVVQLAAQYENWDGSRSLKAWQVAWLWNEWEPVSDNLKGKPCLPTYQRLETHLAAGALPAMLGRSGCWKDAEITRQDLVDYALTLGERPKFLFPEERVWWQRKLREWRKREISPQDADGYVTYSETKLELYKILQIINTEAVADEVKTAMRRGKCDGIARRQVGGLTYGFERIPSRLWSGLTIDWLGNVTGRGVTYTDLRVKFHPGYPRGAQPMPATPANATQDYDEEAEVAVARSRA